MDLQAIGQLIAERRRAKHLTLSQLASRAKLGRSTLAALEAGKLPELGLTRVGRVCVVLDLVLEVRPFLLDGPILPHRHLTAAAGRELTKAAIDDVITRGGIAEWRVLIAAMRNDSTRRVARRVSDIARILAKHDIKARAFAALLPRLVSAPNEQSV